MSTDKRFLVLTDLLMGAVYADDRLQGGEEEAVRKLLVDVIGGDLPIDVEARMANFEKADFDLKKSAVDFAADPAVNKRQLLQLVAAVFDSDDEVDFDEDIYMRDLADALAMDASEFSDLALEYEIEDAKSVASGVLAVPPPKPPV